MSNRGKDKPKKRKDENSRSESHVYGGTGVRRKRMEAAKGGGLWMDFFWLVGVGGSSAISHKKGETSER